MYPYKGVLPTASATWSSRDRYFRYGGVAIDGQYGLVPSNEFWVFSTSWNSSGCNVTTELEAQPRYNAVFNWSKRMASIVNSTGDSLMQACGPQALVVHVERDSGVGGVGFGLTIDNTGRVNGYGAGDESSLYGPAFAAGIVIGDVLCAAGVPLLPLQSRNGSFASSIHSTFHNKNGKIPKKSVHLAFKTTISATHSLDLPPGTQSGANSG